MQMQLNTQPTIACQQFAIISRNSPTPANGDLWQLVAGLEAIALVVIWLMWMVDVRVKNWLEPNLSQEES